MNFHFHRSKNQIAFVFLLLSSLVTLSFSCKKSAQPETEAVENGIIKYKAQPVLKSNTKKVFVHLMPWFETKESVGSWGIHWKMNTKNPDIIGANGQRQIAAHFYPLIGPYASGDSLVIEYQLLLMKLSGMDGIMIDWPGTQNKYDYPLLVKNTEKIVAKIASTGLKYAIVYEDQNLVQTTTKIPTAQNDLRYLQSNHFNNKMYEHVNGKPMLLVFGPQQLQNANDWTNVFSVLDPKPSFFTLWFESNEAGTNAAGEFAWIPQNNLTTLNSFYKNNYSGIKIGSAYPGFVSFYNEGGWGGPTWSIPHNGTNTFSQTLDLALERPLDYIQLATWNDYGEGTMIEPTVEFQYQFLTVLQEKLGVKNINQSHLEMVAKLYELRVKYKGNSEIQLKLDQVFFYIVALKLNEASQLLLTL